MILVYEQQVNSNNIYLIILLKKLFLWTDLRTPDYYLQ